MVAKLIVSLVLSVSLVASVWADIPNVRPGMNAKKNAEFDGLKEGGKTSFARAFAIQPDLLLLDEAFVSLDPDLVDEMGALVQ